jgi:hypothetical protein
LKIHLLVFGGERFRSGYITHGTVVQSHYLKNEERQ